MVNAGLTGMADPAFNYAFIVSLKSSVLLLSIAYSVMGAAYAVSVQASFFDHINVNCRNCVV